MTETKNSAMSDAIQSLQGDLGEQHHQNDGRYIPYGGGSLGWYENSGVPAAEQRNNYKFHTAMDADIIRAKQYLRSGLRAEKRRSARRVVAEELGVTLKSAKETKSLRVIDISKHGAKVQYSGDDVGLKNGDRVVCMFHLGASKEIALELMCTVVRAEKTGKTRTLWNFGIDFPLMKDPQIAKLKELGKLAD
jgi:hypothetical protein